MKRPLFRQLGVSLRVRLCGVACYASALSLDSLDLTKNRPFLPNLYCYEAR